MNNKEFLSDAGQDEWAGCRETKKYFKRRTQKLIRLHGRNLVDKALTQMDIEKEQLREEAEEEEWRNWLEEFGR